jgi:hypothetical protein
MNVRLSLGALYNFFAKLACLSTIQDAVKALSGEFQGSSDKEDAKCLG